jgi:hypothetical protein
MRDRTVLRVFNHEWSAALRDTIRQSHSAKFTSVSNGRSHFGMKPAVSVTTLSFLGLDRRDTSRVDCRGAFLSVKGFDVNVQCGSQPDIDRLTTGTYVTRLATNPGSSRGRIRGIPLAWRLLSADEFVSSVLADLCVELCGD